MRGFFRLSAVYFLIMVPIIVLLRDNPLQFFFNTLATPKAHIGLVIRFLPWLVALFVVFLVINRYRFNRDFFVSAAYALIGGIVFSFTFAAVKPSMPLLLPFFADGFFTEADRVLHFGNDPWQLTHMLAEFVPTRAVTTLYFSVWAALGLFFPLHLALVDNNPDRAARFLLLYVVVWIGLGNFAALAGLSAGPVYHDRLLGGAEFDGLAQALQASGVANTIVGSLQNTLWMLLVERQQDSGSGISAFPSVHVGVATVIALYGIERGFLASIPAVGFGLAIMFLSVYLGWHYAIDGYFSILVVVWVWWKGWALPYKRA